MNNVVNKIILDSKIDSLITIEELIDKLKNELLLNDKVYGKISVALIEAVNNAIVHGNKLDIDKTVEIDYYEELNKLIFNIKDSGEGFDYNNIPDPTLPENIEKINGRGVYLMRQLADEVEFEENGSRIILKFKL